MLSKSGTWPVFKEEREMGFFFTKLMSAEEWVSEVWLTGNKPCSGKGKSFLMVNRKHR